MLRDPRASFIAKRLIFDESPETLSDDDFRFIHKELHDRLVINQHRPFTTIPESMNYIDTELSKIADSNVENKDEKIKIIQDYNKYLIFLEKYFSDKKARPLKTGKKLINQIFGSIMYSFYDANLQKSNFTIFMVYRIILGIIILIL